MKEITEVFGVVYTLATSMFLCVGVSVFFFGEDPAPRLLGILVGTIFWMVTVGSIVLGVGDRARKNKEKEDA